MSSSTRSNDPTGIAQRILVLRGQRVLLDSDLAELYGVSTSRLNQQVRRNRNKAGTCKLDVAFCNIKMPVYVVRAFVRLRQVLASNTELSRKLELLEKSVATLDARTRKQFEEVYGAIRALMAPPAVKSRPIGFTADLDKDS